MRATWVVMLGVALLGGTAWAAPSDVRTLASSASVSPGAVKSSQVSPNDAHVFTTDDGVRLWYRYAGKRDGIPVVFLHGGPGEGSQTFAEFAGPALEQHLRLVYLDQRGSGHSARPKDPQKYSIDRMVEDVELLRRQINAPRIDLIGHSFGTILALEYAARYPAHVSHLVLVSAVPDMPALANSLCSRLAASDPVAYARARKASDARTYPRCNPFEAYPGAAESAFIDRNMFPHPQTAEQVDKADAANGLGNTGESARVLMAHDLPRYRFERYARLSMPVLVIAGADDFETPVDLQQQLASKLPHATFTVFPGSGHFMFVEQPQLFGDDVVDFLNNTHR